MTVSDLDPWDHVLAHRYEEALAGYDARRRAGVIQDALEIANRSTALLCLGKLKEAVEGFASANELAARRLKDDPQPYFLHIGTILWLLGRREEAISRFKAEVDGILEQSVKFADNAGGVSQGLLLWYAGITTAHHKVTEHALEYLRRLARKARIKYWPGPLARFVLGRCQQEEVLQEICGVWDLGTAMNLAKSDLLTRREVAQALFYFGVKKRSERDEGECRNAMRACASLENPIIEHEWYLARAEVGQTAE